MARDKVLGYCNSFIKAIKDYESTFESSGYYDVMIDVIGIDSDTVIDSKEVVEATFELSWHGQVSR